MKIFVFTSFIVCLVTIISPVGILADTALDVYMNDFYTKSNEASQILKEIENRLKEGSRKKVCSRQREAARLGLLANKSLIGKGFLKIGFLSFTQYLVFFLRLSLEQGSLLAEINFGMY